MRYLLALLLLTIASLAAAPSGSIAIDYTSRYTFRGALIAADSIQPTATLNCGPVYGTVWANQPVARGADNEVDFTLGGEILGLDAGITAYTYPRGGETSYEPYLGYSRETGRLKLSAYAFRDVTLHLTTVETKGALQVGSFRSLAVALEASLGASRGREVQTYAYWSAGPTLRYTLSERASLAVGVQYTSSSDRDQRRDILSGRAGMALSF